MLVLGLDPGLNNTGWGLIRVSGSALSHVDNGVIKISNKNTLPERLSLIYQSLLKIVESYSPNSAAVEEVFLNKNPNSTLKLGQARGISLLVPANYGIPVSEYSSTKIKKSLVGKGHAEKEQVRVMVKHLLPGCIINGYDAADALAVAICHSHYSTSATNLSINLKANK
ncbi:MAG: Crossover junction endodeoxyribonuclease RuvC [Alphaproteobacteria bacterium MarineAlpha2_Bin1]|nr:MAG: Crossover junction endodeoxyribonuclease RuvC [Alphaproteobacteria bacterium MarineAlpha2_Bin1]|tara:strand:+ start:432 stop:938 length:507 start_codon:yes stop_codon:yes gene_type:complete